ncbi:MAG: acetolactate synthase small subunit [Lachnospiraceae bacterium]|nr:acetolactate synthase small subunit [Lachnospiraceae bacterium]MBO4696649.1 acetolactate synthase small subunit [Lachnospiraceae bacterium]MBQ6106301.1 acetolactate synthase small subunit [Lachnospiraceae bacterium]
MRKIVLSILVENTAGVLARTSGLFSRRGYNIESLSVGETEDASISRMTVVASGEEETLSQIVKQLLKLEDVISVRELVPDSSVCCELLLLKVNTADSEKRKEALAIAERTDAKVVDVSPETMMLRLTGEPAKVDSFINDFSSFQILELVRTGLTGLARS